MPVLRFRLMSLILLAGLVLAGCSAAASTPQPIPTDPPAPDLALDGIWVGKTSQDKDIFFTITNSKLTQFQLNYAFETCTNTKYTAMLTPPGFGNFTGHTLSVETPHRLTITFESDSSAQGSFDFDTSLGVLASSCQPGLKENIQFTVHKQVRQTAPTAPAAAPDETPAATPTP